jgi:kinesin family protein 2/24
VTCLNPVVTVHGSKLKVDGISKYLDNTSYEVDHSFDEDSTTEQIYKYSVQSLVPFVVNGGRATCFAYGQTGSGKTYTMQGIQKYMVGDLYAQLASAERGVGVQVYVSYFEIYGGRCQDLLNNRQRLQVREDGSGDVVVGDLQEIAADSGQALGEIIDLGNANRTTHATESNDESSRSHAICQIVLRKGDKLMGRLSLIDLAGSERGADTKSHNQQRRLEGAEINKSLLALKECIRSIDNNKSHVPYRGSKLTLVLKDSFTSKTARTVMIATVSPAASSADHTLNTLRYADRIKERKVGALAAFNAKNPGAAAAAIAKENAPKGGGNAAAAAIGGDAAAAAGKGAAAAGGRSAALEAKHADSPPRRALPGAAAAGAAGGSDAEDVFRMGREDDGGDNRYDDDDDDDDENAMTDEFHQTVEHIFEEEEELLNLHMNIIQENAELLTEEGRLLQQIQGDEDDIDAYAKRLDAILNRKQVLITHLRDKLSHFVASLKEEETLSKTQMLKAAAGAGKNKRK